MKLTIYIELRLIEGKMQVEDMVKAVFSKMGEEHIVPNREDLNRFVWNKNSIMVKTDG